MLKGDDDPSAAPPPSSSAPPPPSPETFSCTRVNTFLLAQITPTIPDPSSNNTRALPFQSRLWNLESRSSPPSAAMTALTDAVANRGGAWWWCWESACFCKFFFFLLSFVGVKSLDTNLNGVIAFVSLSSSGSCCWVELTKRCCLWWWRSAAEETSSSSLDFFTASSREFSDVNLPCEHVNLLKDWRRLLLLLLQLVVFSRREPWKKMEEEEE